MEGDLLEEIVRKALKYSDGICTFAFQGGEPTLAGNLSRMAGFVSEKAGAFIKTVTSIGFQTWQVIDKGPSCPAIIA